MARKKSPHPVDLLITREQWLENAVHASRYWFKAAGYELPTVKVSCSWPGGGSARKRIGECWPKARSAAGINEIFISPVVEDAVDVLDILFHELCHAIDDCKSGHGKAFGKIARQIGLEGKLTATHAGPDLKVHLQALAAQLGPYPHAKLDLTGRKKDGVRQLKCQCLDPDCAAIWRMTKQWVEMAVTSDRGLTCPVCGAEGGLG